MIPVTARPDGQGGSVGVNTLHGVALPVARDTAELARTTIQSTGVEDRTFSAFRIPAEAILDLVSISYTPDREALLGPNCEPFTFAGFDRATTPLGTDREFFAISRRSLGTGSGIELLQRTRSSERDFEAASPLRRSLRRQ
jgi:hypothetical protein